MKSNWDTLPIVRRIEEATGAIVQMIEVEPGRAAGYDNQIEDGFGHFYGISRPAKPGNLKINLVLTSKAMELLEAPKEETAVSPKNEKMKRFYVGRQGVTSSDWAHFTEKDAIAHAKRLVEETGKDQVIVKVIKVVRRKPQPIVVETLRG